MPAKTPSDDLTRRVWREFWVSLRRLADDQLKILPAEWESGEGLRPTTTVKRAWVYKWSSAENIELVENGTPLVNLNIPGLMAGSEIFIHDYDRKITAFCGSSREPTIINGPARSAYLILCLWNMGHFLADKEARMTIAMFAGAKGIFLSNRIYQNRHRLIGDLGPLGKRIFEKSEKHGCRIGKGIRVCWVRSSPDLANSYWFTYRGKPSD